MLLTLACAAADPLLSQARAASRCLTEPFRLQPSKHGVASAQRSAEGTRAQPVLQPRPAQLCLAAPAGACFRHGLCLSAACHVQDNRDRKGRRGGKGKRPKKAKSMQRGVQAGRSRTQRHGYQGNGAERFGVPAGEL